MPSLLTDFVSDFDQLTPGQRKTLVIWLAFSLTAFLILCFTVLMILRPVFCLAALSLCCCCCFCTSPPEGLEEFVRALVQEDQQAHGRRT